MTIFHHSEKTTPQTDRLEPVLAAKPHDSSPSPLPGAAANGARSGASEIRQGAHDAVEAGRELLEGVRELAREGYQGAKNATSEATSSLRATVARHPVSSLGIAAGAGVLLGGLIIWRLGHRN